MNKTTLLALIASFAITACSGETDDATSVADTKQPWADFVATVIDDYYRQNPESASDAGLHQYDGQMSDMSAAGLAASADWIDAVIAEAATYTGIEDIEAFERDYLSTSLSGQLFWLRDSDFPTRNPLFYISAIGISVFVDREYAPLDQRMQAYTQYMQQLPGMLRQMKENLQPP